MIASMGLLFLALGTGLAAPTPSDPGHGGVGCLAIEHYHVAGEEVITGAPEIVTGFRCTSLKTVGCSLAHSATFTKGVIKTVDGSLSPALSIAKVFTAGASAGFSYSWTTSSATGSTATVDCPAGEYECGLRVVPTLVRSHGTVDVTYTNDCLKAHTASFYVTAPKIIKDAPTDQQAIMDFKACVYCTGSKCADAAKIGLEPCP